MKKEELIRQLERHNTYNEEEEKAKKSILEFLHSNDNFTGRDNKIGHITGAAWIVSRDRKKVLLTHHLKLKMWVQLGGHVDDGESILETALRESREESGLTSLKVLSEDIFDVDVHLFPKRGEVDEHYHFDIRYLLEADEDEEIKPQISETKEIKWVALEEVRKYSYEENIWRMAEKTKKEP